MDARDVTGLPADGDAAPIAQRRSMDMPERYHTCGDSQISVYSIAASQRHHAHKQSLGLTGLVCLIFLEVAGGPFGTEDAVAAAGPRWAILGFAVLPLLWSVPEALVCAELATAFPENAGYVAWVEAAFGPFAGFLEGHFSWVSGVTDNTIYPVMFLAYLQLFVPALSSFWIEKAALAGASLAMTALNYRGLDIVGHASEVVVFVTLAPFVVLTLLALPRVHPARWLAGPPGGRPVNWQQFANVLFWNLNSWDSVSTLAGEVRNPGKMFPRALFIAVQLVILGYLLPLMIGIGVTGGDDAADGDAWKLGYFGHVAAVVGGAPLAAAVVVAAAVSQVGMFEAEMSADSYQVLGMAERGYLPAALARRSRYGTPTIGIALSSLGIVATLLFPFMQIVEMLNAAYALGELLEFAAFIWLRVKCPDLRRAYRVPLPVWGLVLMLLPPSALLLTVLVLPAVRGDWALITYTAGVALVGVGLYAALQVARRARLVTFEHSDALAADRWHPASLAVGLSAFPGLVSGVALLRGVGLSGPASGLLGVAAAAAVAGLLWPLLVHVLQREHVGYAPVHGSGSLGASLAAVGGLSPTPLASAALQSIPEASEGPQTGTNAPLMTAFLSDSLASARPRNGEFGGCKEEP